MFYRLSITHMRAIGLAVTLSGPIFADESGVTYGVDIKTCQKALQRSQMNRSMSGLQKHFMKNIFLPIVGMRGVDYPHEIREDSLLLKGYPNSNKKYLIEFDHTASSMQLDTTSTQTRKLIVPTSISTIDAESASLTKRFLLGHPLHPFMVDQSLPAIRRSLGEPKFLLRLPQIEAIKAGNIYLDRFAAGEKDFQHFLYVAPTGTGKSEIYQELLIKRLSHSANQRLIVTLSERANVVRDRMKDTKELLELGHDFHLIHWGGVKEANQGITSFEELLKLVKNSKKPVVLVSTCDSFMMEAEKTSIDLIKKNLRGIFFDEAHHLGGEKIYSFIEDLTSNSQASNIGFTATPINRNTSIQGIYKDRGFWAYIDDADSFVQQPRPLVRDTRIIALQLKEAIDSGDIVGFDKVNYIPLGNSREPSMVKQTKTNSAGQTTKLNYDVVNPKLYGELLKALLPALRRGKTLVIANDIVEAEALNNLINRLPKGDAKIKSELITSKNAPAGSATEQTILENFRLGKTTVLVSVEKLDEGINIHDSDTYVELSEKINARRFLQRLGRTTRVSPNKTEIGLYMVTSFNQEVLRNRLTEVFQPQTAGQRNSFERSMENANEDFSVDYADFMTALTEKNVVTLDFWNEDKFEYSQSIPDLLAFQNDVLKDTAESFPGYTAKTFDYFISLAPLIADQTSRDEYIKAIEDIKVPQGAFSDATHHEGSGLRPTDSIHRAFVIFAEHAGFNIELPLTLDQLIQWGVTEGRRYSVEMSDLKRFQNDVIMKSSELFPGSSRNGLKVLQSFAENLGNSQSLEYLKTIETLGISDRTFQNARTKFKSADVIHRVFLTYARLAGHDHAGVVNINDLREWGLVEESDSQDALEYERFRGDVLAKMQDSLRGFITQSQQYFASLAQRIDKAKRGQYLRDLAEIKILKGDLKGTRMAGIQRVHAALLLFARHVRYDAGRFLTLEDIKKMGLWSESIYSMPEEELLHFQDDVFSNVETLFHGYLANTEGYFRWIAENIADIQQREAFLRDIHDLGLPKDFYSPARFLITTDKFYRAFELYAKYTGKVVGSLITASDLVTWGIAKSERYALDEDQLEVFRTNILMKHKELFAGFSKRSPDFFMELSERILVSESRQKYLQEIRELRMSQTALISSKTERKPADDLYRALNLFGQYAGYEVSSPLDEDQLYAWGLLKRDDDGSTR